MRFPSFATALTQNTLDSSRFSRSLILSLSVAWSLAAQLLLAIGTLFEFQSANWKIVPLSHCAKLIFIPPPPAQQQAPSRPAAAAQGGGSNNVHHHKCNKTQKDNKPIVYNLGHPRTDGSKALLAWNALLHQMVHHATVRLHDAVDAGLLPGGDGDDDSGNIIGSGGGGDAASILSVPYEIASTSVGGIRLTDLDPNDDTSWSKAIHCMSCNLLWLSDRASHYVQQKVLLATAMSS